jgi:hypothetical protein
MEQTLLEMGWEFWYSKEKTSVISFNIEGIHPYDISTIVTN